MTDKMIALRHDRVLSIIGQIDSKQLDRALLVVLGARAMLRRMQRTIR